MRVPSQRLGTVPLIAVADVQLAQGPETITRYDRDRQANVRQAASTPGNYHQERRRC
jgi:multidrug efflux pump subunit AcrB